MSSVIIKRFVSFNGHTVFSVRQRSDGFYQIFRDGTFVEDGTQPYWEQDEPISGLFGDAAIAEQEIIRWQLHCEPVH